MQNHIWVKPGLYKICETDFNLNLSTVDSYLTIYYLKYNNILFECEPKIIDIYKKKICVVKLKNNLCFSIDIFSNHKCKEKLDCMIKLNVIFLEPDVLKFSNGYLTFGINAGYHVIKLDTNDYSNDNRLYIVHKHIDIHNSLNVLNIFNVYNVYNVIMTSSHHIWLKENLERVLLLL